MTVLDTPLHSTHSGNRAQPSSCPPSAVFVQADLVERLAELLKQTPSYTCRQTAATEQACTDLRQYLHARWGLHQLWLCNAAAEPGCTDLRRCLPAR